MMVNYKWIIQGIDSFGNVGYSQGCNSYKEARDLYNEWNANVAESSDIRVEVGLVRSYGCLNSSYIRIDENGKFDTFLEDLEGNFINIPKRLIKEIEKYHQ